MKLELLLQVIVPLTFLAIWALTSLLNRDAQPLPPRPGTRPPGTGPGMGRSSYSPPMRPEATRPTSPSLDRTSPGRWATTTAAGRTSPSYRGSDEGIVILDDDRRGTSAAGGSSSARSARGLGPAARKAAARVRSAIAVPAQTPERSRTLAGLTAEPLAPRRGKPLEMTPLSAPIAPITATPLTVDSSAPGEAASVIVSPGDTPTLTANELGAMLASPKRLREVALLGEILRPPVSLREPRQRR